MKTICTDRPACVRHIQIQTLLACTIIIVFQHVNTLLPGQDCAGGNWLLGWYGVDSFLSRANFDSLLQRKRFANSGSITQILISRRYFLLKCSSLAFPYPVPAKDASFMFFLFECTWIFKSGCKFLQSSLAGSDSRDRTLKKEMGQLIRMLQCFSPGNGTAADETDAAPTPAMTHSHSLSDAMQIKPRCGGWLNNSVGTPPHPATVTHSYLLTTAKQLVQH